MPRKLIKIMSAAILILLGILVLIMGIQESEFGNIKKYDKKSGDKSFSNMVAPGRTDRSRHDQSVKLEGNSRANLGDFNFNIAGDKTLVANISLKYKSTKEEKDWFGDSNDIEDEIIKKSVLLRDATINTMIGNKRATINSEKIRRELKKSINENLTCGEVEEVYFNKFLIQ